MSKIIPCDEQVLCKVPNVLDYFYNIYEDNIFEVYAVANNDKITGFIGILDDFCSYLKIEEEIDLTIFYVDENRKLTNMYREGYRLIIGNDNLIFIDEETGKEHMLCLVPMPYRDGEGYDGIIAYSQYNSNLDINCELQYQQMYNKNNPIIYEYHTKYVDKIFIDKRYSKKDFPDKGLVLNREYYVALDLTNDYSAQRLCSIRENGLFSRESLGGNDLYRYFRVVCITKDHEYKTLYPYTRGYGFEELKKLLESYGFNTQIPEYILDTYNGHNVYLNEIKNLLEQINSIKEEDKEMYMKLQINNN